MSFYFKGKTTAIRTSVLIICLITLIGISSVFALDPPHNNTNLISCNSCHVGHTAGGSGFLINSEDVANLCISCHTPAGQASSHPFTDADQANPGISGTSHRWDSGAAGFIEASISNTSPGKIKSHGIYTGTKPRTYTITIASGGDSSIALFNWSDTNGGSGSAILTGTGISLNDGVSLDFINGGTSPSFISSDTWTLKVIPDLSNPQDPRLAARLELNQVVCSTCHGQHTHITETVPAPGNSSIGKIYSGGSYSGPNMRSYTITIVSTGDLGSARLNWLDDLGASGSNILLDYNIELNDGIKLRCFDMGATPNFNAGDTWTFQVTWPKFLRARNVEDTLCLECHGDWNLGTYAENSANRGSHPVLRQYPPADPEYYNDPIIDPAITLVDGKVACSSCHSVHGADSGGTNSGLGDGYILDTANDANLCKSCHDLADHDVPGHTFSCRDCHTPHMTGNILLVRESISTPNSGDKTVLFNAEEGTSDSLADGDGIDGICEICHTSTAYHQNSDTPSRNGTHYPSYNCMQCHTHDEGFKPKCYTCHGNETVKSFYPDESVFPDTAGKHQAHAGDRDYPCFYCHAEPVGAPGHDADSQPAEVVLNGSIPLVGASASYSGSSSPYNNGTCANVYCHGEFTGGNTANDPAWDTASAPCGSCHDSNPATNGHPAHLTEIYGPNINCDACHGIGADTGTHGSHVDGAVSFADGLNMTSTNTCNNCHSSDGAAFAKSYWTQGQGQWRAAMGETNYCGSCHDSTPGNSRADGAGRDAPDIAGDDLTYGFMINGHGEKALDCSSCHDITTDHNLDHQRTYNSTLDNFQAAYRLDYSNGALNMPRPDSALIYPDNPDFTFCFRCHNETLLVSSLSGDSTPGCIDPSSDRPYISERGTNFWGIGSANSYTNNWHWYHLATNCLTGWDTDYDGDVETVPFSCVTCHDVHGAGSYSGGTVFSSMTRYEMGIQSEPTYGSVTDGAYRLSPGMRCNPCHVGAPLTYARNKIVTGCVTCHGGEDNLTGAPPADTIGRTDPTFITIGTHSTHVSGSGANLDCTECHQKPVTTTVENDHRNGNGNVRFDYAAMAGYGGYSPIYDQGVTNTCTNVYCHGVSLTGGSDTTPQWNDPITGACGTCHGISTLTMTSGSHAVHFNSVKGPGITDCVVCHNDNSTVHSTIDGSILFNDSQDLAGTTTCNNCHGVTAGTKPSWGSGTLACTQCHKSGTPANSAADGSGISAPYMADFITTGHGLNSGSQYSATNNSGAGYTNCINCHEQNPTAGTHISGTPGDYSRLIAITTSDGLDYTDTLSDFCLECHQPNQTSMDELDDADAEANVHSGGVNDNYNTAILAPNAFPAYGNDSDYSASPGYQCLDCHNPHGTSNLAMILESIDGKLAGVSNPQAITLTGALTNLDPTTTPDDGLCDRCHTAPGEPHPDTTLIGNHNQGANCSSCHSHKKGFMATCDICHGYPPTTADSFLDNTDAVGIHNLHTGNPFNYKCTECHYNYVHNESNWVGDEGLTQTIPTANIQVAFNTANGWNTTAGYDSATNTCSNVTCHNPDVITTKTGSATTNSPVWINSYTAIEDCTACHAYTVRQNPTDSGSHYFHENPDVEGYSCKACHDSVDISAAGYSGSDPNHADKTVNFDQSGDYPISFNTALDVNQVTGSESYADGAPGTTNGGTCSGLYCHGASLPATSQGDDITPVWGDQNTAFCGSCHEDSPKSDGFSAGPHYAHFRRDAAAYGPGPTISDHAGNVCYYCHATSDSNCSQCHSLHSYQGFLSYYPHADGKVDFNDDPDYLELAATAVCDNCHSTATVNGLVGSVVAKTNWPSDTRITDCLLCHNGIDPANHRASGTGLDAPDILGDDTTYGAQVTGHNKSTGSYAVTSLPAADFECAACHDTNSGGHITGTADDSTRLNSISSDGLDYTNTGSELCLDCHVPDQTVPGSLGYDSSAEASVHSGGVNDRYNTAASASTAFPAYGNNADYAANPGYQCANCHNPHGTTNIAMINTTIDGNLGGVSNPQTITFTGPMENLDPAGDDNGVCDRCHNATGDTSPHPDTLYSGNHNYNQNCSSCHSHRKSFMASCDDCHGSPPNDTDTFLDNANAVGVHELHTGAPYNYNCEECHYGNNHNQSNWNGGEGTSQTIPSGNVDITFNSTGGWNSTASYDSASNTCYNVTCHNPDVVTGKNTSATTNSPVWTDSFSTIESCIDCHAMSASSSQSDSGSHYAHENPATKDIPCRTCHNSVDISAGGYLSSDTAHADKTVNQDQSGTYPIAFDTNLAVGLITGSEDYTDGSPGTSAGGGCAGIYCHGDSLPVDSRGSDTTPVWGNGNSAVCGTCHKSSGKALHSSPFTSGPHYEHLRQDAGAYGPGPTISDHPGASCAVCHNIATMPCDQCHVAHVGQDFEGYLLNYSHVDGKTDFNDSQTLPATSNCDNCHSTATINSQVGRDVAKTNWPTGTRITDCLLCHNGVDPANHKVDGTGRDAPDILGDNTTYGIWVTGHGKASGNYSTTNLPAANMDCAVCHDSNAGDHISGMPDDADRLNTVPSDGLDYTGPASEACLDCHKPDQSGIGTLGYDSSAEATVHSGGVTGNFNTSAAAPAAFPAYGNAAGYAADPGYQCGNCHNPHGTTNIAMINTTIDGKVGGISNPQAVTFTGSMTNLDPVGADNGVCDRCHTTAGVPHPDTTASGNHNQGANCIDCHSHKESFDDNCTGCHSMPPDGSVSPNIAGAHAAHMTDANGPGISSCFVCHADLSAGEHQNSFTSFASGTDQNANNNIELNETDVCDACHSPDGPFNGVTEAVSNWATSTPVSCEGCHDNGTSTINGVTAPPVAGNNTTWGFYASGHGRNSMTSCTDCHDTTVAHIDGLARTYTFDSAYYGPTQSGVAYAAAYRLSYVDEEVPLMIPANYNITFSYDAGLMKNTAFRLCFGCHNSDTVLDDSPGDGLDTNFKASLPNPPRNYSYAWGSGADVNEHVAHIMNYIGPFADSDWDTNTDGPGGTNGLDTMMACSNCHNVHGAMGAEGSSNESMIRDGTLAGRPGGYGFSYVIEDTGSGGYPMVTSTGADQSNSVGAIFRYNTEGNNMCGGSMCHGDPTPPAAAGYDATGSSWGSYLEFFREASEISAGCNTCHGYPPDGIAYPDTAGAHAVHMNGISGPGITSCFTCHSTLGGGTHKNLMASFASGTDINGNSNIELNETDVCDPCHSPDGPFNGATEALANWASSTPVSCEGCHDNGTSTINGVNAPPVAGNNSTWGYYATGHGKNLMISCIDCHDTNTVHIDGNNQTYSAASDNYQAGFRLSDVNGGTPLFIPRTGPDSQDPYNDPPYWDLCFSCHSKYALLGGPTAPVGPYNFAQFNTNFRSEASVIIPDGLSTDIASYSMTGAVDTNSHYTHMISAPAYYDSDRDGNLDSYSTCIACHNIHGSTSPPMIRDGKLIDKEPALNFSRVRYDRHDPFVGGCADPIIITSEGGIPVMDSHGGVMRSDSGPAANGVCSFCHAGGSTTEDPEYIINCFGPDAVDYYRNPVGTPSSCSICHSQPAGSRRQILDSNGDGTGIGGDFIRNSHHLGGIAYSDQANCLVCHDQSNHKSGTVTLRHPDTGASITFNTAADLEPFCASCHDSDGATATYTGASASQPFTDNQTVPVVTAGWASASHKTNGSAPLGCYGDGSSTGCHANAHGSDKNKMLAPYDSSTPVEEDFCFSCHDSTGPASSDISSEYATTTTWVTGDVGSSNNLNLNDRHDIQTSAQSVSGAVIECINCHDPHSASSADPLVADPDPTDGRLPGTGQVLAGADFTTEWCLDCHDGSFPSTITAPSTSLVNVRTTYQSDTMGQDSGSAFLKSGYGWDTDHDVPCLSCHTGMHVSSKNNLFHLTDIVKSEDGLTDIPSDGAGFAYEVTDNDINNRDINGYEWCNTCHSNSMGRNHSACFNCHYHGSRF